MASYALEQSRLELAGEYERVQKKAFTNWVNSHLIKAGQKVNDLYEDLKDGSRLLLLLELLTGEKLRREKGKMRVHKLQNVQNALDFLQKDKKIKLVNIRNDEIVDGNPKLILGLVWTLILHFQISESLQSHEDSVEFSPTHQVSAKEVKGQLLEWARRATEGYEEVEVTNFHKSWRDGLAFCAILDRHRPDLLNYDDFDPDKPMENLEKAFKVAEEELGIIRIVDPEDICVEKPDEKAVMTYVSFLHHAFPTMPPPHRKKAPVVSMDDYRDLYQSTKQWMDQRTAEIKNREFPNNVTDMKAQMSSFKKWRGQEVPVKRRDMDTLADLHSKLQQESQKKKRKSPRSPTIPPELAYPPLEMDWVYLEKESEVYDKAMQQELQRLEELQRLAEKILADCDTHNSTLDHLEEQVKTLEEKSASLPPEEAMKMADQIKREIKSLERAVNELSSGVQQLKDGKYHDVDTVQQRVDALRSRLSSLPPRLEGAQSAASEAQAVVVIETNLKELEVWLLSCGKFADNQQILMQIEDHKVFQLDQLEVAQERISRLNSSPPPPGLEDMVSEVNSRWEQVVKQTKDRIAGLEPIAATVRAFDVVRNPLEDWSTQRREFFENVPPLEMTVELLREQLAEASQIRDEAAEHKEAAEKLEELSERFLRDTEPVQSLADRYARKLKTQKVTVTVRKKSSGSREGSADLTEASLGEQAGILQSQWEWLKAHAESRANQISDLLNRLSQFNQEYDALREFVKKGNKLLDGEKPVGDSAARIQEQMETCQDFRSQITAKQPEVDTMLSLGRAIIAEPNTNPQNDTLMQNLTGFIEDWSDLQLSWQNWYDELHANLEQSKNLSDQLNSFGHDVDDLEPVYTSIFPATVDMESLKTELEALQALFTTEVLHPYEERQAAYTSLKSNASLLPDSQSATEAFEKFENVASTIESCKDELSQVVSDVGAWWGVCDGVREWLREAESLLADQRPLAGSVDIVEKQRNAIQKLSEETEAHRTEMEKVLQALSALATHNKILNPAHINTFADKLRNRWDLLCQEVGNGAELATAGKDHLVSYAGHSPPFAIWLSGAEGRLGDLGPVPRSKERLFSHIEEFKSFASQVEAHGKDLEEVEKLGSQFVGCAKAYQTQLLDYRRKLNPDEGGTLPEFFVDTQPLSPLESQPQFEGDVYENGIIAVSGDASLLRRRYDDLLGGVRQQKHHLEDAKTRRQDLDSALEAFLPQLSALEERCEGISGDGVSQPERIQARVEAVQTLEVDCLALEPQLQSIRSAYDLWADVEDGRGSAEGEDDALKEKESAEHRYNSLLEKLSNQKDALHAELSNAQAFHDAFSDFNGWLRETERKIQRDDPLKLEVAELTSGLQYLQGIAADIGAHENAYEAICTKCQDLISRGVQDTEELQQNLENFQQRWNALAIVNDDIEVIEETIPKLEAYYSSYGGISAGVDDLLERVQACSASAISMEGIGNKNQQLQELSGEVNQQRMQFDSLLSSCDLLETPFDQTQFENDVSQLQEKLAQCDKVASEKKQKLKSLERKVQPMEDLFRKFKAWMKATEGKLKVLSPPSVEREEREKQLHEADVIIKDVREHKETLEKLENAVDDLLPLVDETDQQELSSELQNVTYQYTALQFDCSCYPVERWLDDRTSQLCEMAATGVLVSPLQEQIREVQGFQKAVESYKPELENLTTLLAECEGSTPDQSAPSTDETNQSSASLPKSKMAEIWQRYDNLKVVAAVRTSMLSSFVPTVQQYESSQGAFATLLCGWEEKAAILPPPGARPETVQGEMEDVQALLQAVTDHEPELVSLKKESQKLGEGAPLEPDYYSKLSQVTQEASVSGQARPGQEQQEETLIDFSDRLEALKRKLTGVYSDLISQLQKAKELQDVLQGLLAWVTEVDKELDGLEVRDPSSAAIDTLQQKCQDLLQQLAERSPEKDKLAPLFDALTSQLPDENADRESLKSQLVELNTRWSNLSDQLGKHQTNLDTALGLARNYEGSSQKLLPWVPNTLGHLESLGPPPTEPDAVEKLKSEIEGLKSEYNALAPAYAVYTESGHSLAERCQDPDQKSSLEGSVAQVQADWERLGQLFGDLLQKLTDALVQTQEFQTIASGLGRWMDGMQDFLKQQGLIAARVKLIEGQIEGFKPVLSDITAYGGTVEQVKTIGSALIEESDQDERQKIQNKLESLTSQFSQLQNAAQTRMSDLEDALKRATEYEDQSNTFDKWLQDAEGRLSSWEPHSIASQPLKRQLEAIKEFVQEVESHKPGLHEVTAAEESLFPSDLQTIQLCEEHILPKSPTTPRMKGSQNIVSKRAIDGSLESSVDVPPRQSLESSVDKPSLPAWLERPGAPEAVEVGADLRGRYDKLKLTAGVKCDEASQLIEQVLRYESNYGKFSDWLKGERAAIALFSPPAITCEELKTQLKQVEDCQCDFKNREGSLESINAAGTSLVDNCQEELSRDSGRIKLSDLNDSWGNGLAELSSREDKLKEGIRLAEKYQGLHDVFDTWLTGCEAQSACPLKTHGDPLDIRKQLEDMKALQCEVSSHLPQLDETVTAGRELEGYTDAEKSSLPDIGYAALQERYAALKLLLGNSVSSLEGSLGQVSSLKEKLRDLLDKLEGWREALKDHEPSHVLPSDVEKQLQSLSSLEQNVSELQPTVTQVQEEGAAYASQEGAVPSSDEDVPSGAEFQELLTGITNANDKVKDLLGYWKDILSAGLSTAKKFDTDYGPLSEWIKAKHDVLTNADAVAGRPEAVEVQLQQLQTLLDDITQHKPLVSDLVSLGHSMMDYASPEDSVVVGDKLALIQVEFEALQRHAIERKKILDDGYKQASEFAAAWSAAMDTIASKREELEQFDTIGMETDTVKTQLDEYKEFEASLADLKPRITSVLTQGKHLKESCSSKDVPFITEQLEKLTSSWSKLYSDGLGRKHQLEDALLQLGQFHDALAGLLTWIDGSTGKLSDGQPPGARPETVEAQLHELESVESGISSHEPSVSSLNTAGEKLVTSSSGENTVDIQQDISELNERWSSLKSLAAKKREILSDALEKANCFHENRKQQASWLSGAERRAYAKWKPCGLPETAEADITKHQAFTSEVQGHSEAIESLRIEGDEVKSRGGRNEQHMIDRWIADILQRWEDLTSAMEEREVQLHQAKTRADEFDAFYRSLRDNLSAYEDAQQPIHSEVEAVKQQLDTHKDSLKQLVELESQLDELVGIGHLLSRDCVQGDKEVILQRVDDLRSRWDLFNSSAMDRQSDLEESLLSLGQFEEAYGELWAWLQDALRQLEVGEPITGDPDAVAAQLAKHKALRKQLGARLSSRNAVTKEGKSLMKQKTGEDKAILKKKLGDLDREWARVDQMSVERQKKLDNAYHNIGQFRSHLGPLRSWMAKVLPTLDESEPVHGDIDTVDSLAAQHASFQKELGSYQKSIDATNASGEHLISEVLDDPTVTQQDLQELNSTWEDICQRSVKKQERLDDAYESARAFEESYAELLLWMDEELQLLLTNEDDHPLQQQIEDHKALSQQVAGRQPDYDRVTADGKHLLQLAHPSAVPLLQSNLQQLEWIWVDLRGRVGARGEVLASSLMKLHGLQETLDTLWKWMGEAEATMTENEAQPVGDSDLATVEQQLAEHEAFQEDMATYQPKMNALNNAAKKKRGAPHANPEMTKKISNLYKRWQKLWVRSDERRRQLHEARTRLQDIALARSFNFDAWKQRFIAWVDQQKLRVSDLFRRFDSNHDGILTREEFMKGLKASGLAMNQIETEKIADAFDRNQDGMIDHSEIMAVLKGTKRTRPVITTKAAMTDAEKIEHELQHQVSKCTCSKQFKITRVAEGQYRFGDSQKLRLVRILRSTVMVRVGGGWEALEGFLEKHDPCRASGRTNAALRNMLGQSPGLATAHFQSKTQTATAAKNAAMKKAAVDDQVTSRTLPSGRKETVISTKTGKKSREGTPTRTEPIKYTLAKRTPAKGTQGNDTTVPKFGSPSGIPQRVTTPSEGGRRTPTTRTAGGRGPTAAVRTQSPKPTTPPTTPVRPSGGPRASKIPTPRTRTPSRPS